MALALSGLPTDRFTFEGFLPRTLGARQSAFENLRFEERTMIFFEAPHRLEESLQDAVSILGADRKAAICREMTKTYEETIRGGLAQLLEWARKGEVLGEITLVVAGAELGSAQKTSAEMVARVREFEAAGMERKSAISTVADEFDLPKRIVYAAVVEANKMSS
jgi:16S rRNA (cytidine1402-2'-O)-methyltransferase